MKAWLYANSGQIARTIAHASYMGASIYIAAHPQYAVYAPVLQYLGQSLDSPR